MFSLLWYIMSRCFQSPVILNSRQVLQKFHQLVTYPVVMKADQHFYTEIKHGCPASPGLDAGKGSSKLPDSYSTWSRGFFVLVFSNSKAAEKLIASE